ncbi:IMPACT family protein [Parapedobacter sp. 10938]|uniref:IMPACT family protein n=1 Tax=Parapedobacter flavus TaxID=3110225 RepID=UPI002DBD0D46|nr:YigZ family protein [Parapedobacter sp. 10938]MEC3880381.1 YigZ family protein [Parapedobacter sp. 10938]
MSLFEDTYKTIAAPAEGQFKDRGSKFIAYAYPLRDEAAVKELVGALKAQHPKARHHCWAYRLTPDRSVFRINDDGEPSGTAGRPILNSLLSADITNVLVVVVRYFGGTLLGVPGLIHAYKAASLDALSAAEIVELTVNDVYRVAFAYEQLNEVMRVVKAEDLNVLKQDFDNTCAMELEIRQTQVAQVLGRLGKVEGAVVDFLRTV